MVNTKCMAQYFIVVMLELYMINTFLIINENLFIYFHVKLYASSYD